MRRNGVKLFTCSRVIVLIPAISILVLAGCSTKFERVDFKYTSDAHLPPSARFLDVAAPATNVSKQISEFLLKCGGTVQEQQDDLKFYYAPTLQGEEAYKAARAIFEKEWEAYRENDITIYRSIDRKDPKLMLPDIVKVDDDKIRSSYLSAAMSQRKGETIRSLSNLAPVVGFWAFFVDWKHDENIDTVLRVWWWPNAGQTKVYARAVPHMIDYKVEASAGAWVLHNLWQTTSGVAEATVVQQLFAFLKGDTKNACAVETATK